MSSNPIPLMCEARRSGRPEPYGANMCLACYEKDGEKPGFVYTRQTMKPGIACVCTNCIQRGEALKGLITGDYYLVTEASDRSKIDSAQKS